MRRAIPFIILVGLIMFCGFQAVKSQGLLTDSIHRPLQGDIQYRFYMDRAAVQPGPAGANQTWNFSGLVPDGFVDTITYLPVPQQFQADFPQANLAARGGFWFFPPLQDHYDFYRSDSGILEYHGWAQPLSADGSPSPFSLADSMYNFPLNFGTQQTDSFAGAMHGFPGLIPFEGNSRTWYDGHGSLMLGGQTIQNVFRIRETLMGPDIVNSRIYEEAYRFFTADHKWPHLTIRISAGQVSEVFTAEPLIPTWTESSQGNAMYVFPSPADERLFVSIPQRINSIVDIQVTDLAGSRNKVQVQRYATFLVLEVGNLPNGIFILFITSESGPSLRQKIVVRH